MKIESGGVYRIEFVEDVTVTVMANEDPAMSHERDCKVGEKDVVEIVELYDDTATIYWNAQSQDEIDNFAEDVPLSSFKVLAKRKIEWITS